MSRRQRAGRADADMLAALACVLALALALGARAAAAAADVDVVRLVSSDDDDSPKLRYYYGALTNYTELPLREAELILARSPAWYDGTRTTLVIAHGFTGSAAGEAVATLADAFLARGDCNVALLNWQRWAAAGPQGLTASYLNWAAPNARKLGVLFAEALERLAAAGLRLQHTHLVGHSLGAHVLGVAGNTLRTRNITLPWITGLDPASAAFEGRAAAARLHAGSARAVLALHSDPAGYGLRRALGAGAADFWPDLERARQPGCPGPPHPRFSPEDLCSHNRSWRLLAEAVRRPGALRGRRARSRRAWKSAPRPDPTAITLDLDAYGKAFVPGNYYLVTRTAAPFGLGEAGL